MIVKVTVAGQSFVHEDVVRIWADERGYLHAELAGYPHLVHWWRGSGCTSVLIAASGEEFTRALREEIDDSHLGRGHRRQR